MKVLNNIINLFLVSFVSVLVYLFVIPGIIFSWGPSCALISENTYCTNYCDDGCEALGLNWPGCYCCTSCIGTCGVGKSLELSRCYCPGEYDVCDGCCDSGGCFTGETDVMTSQGVQEIKNLQAGDEVVSLDTQTGENKTSLVEKVYEVSRDAYYKIKTKAGNEIKVTAEHPLYVIQKSVAPFSFWEHLKTESLTKKAIDYINNKISNL